LKKLENVEKNVKKKLKCLKKFFEKNGKNQKKGRRKKNDRKKEDRKVL